MKKLVEFKRAIGEESVMVDPDAIVAIVPNANGTGLPETTIVVDGYPVMLSWRYDNVVRMLSMWGRMGNEEEAPEA